MESKKLLLGVNVIIEKGEFKGVTGFLQSMDVNVTHEIVRNNKNRELITFKSGDKIICRVVVNPENTISVPLEYLSGLQIKFRSGYLIELNKIYNEDCLDYFKLIPDNNIDLVITDPP